MAQFRVSLFNSAGELDVRVVGSEEETRAAALDIISGTAFLSDGDRITVTEITDHYPSRLDHYPSRLRS